MWITVKRLWLAAAVLWTMVWCIASGLVVDTEDVTTAPDFLPVVLAHSNTRDEASEDETDRRDSTYDAGTIRGALRDEGTATTYNQDDLSCTELRSKRYISDGFCTSAKPITEVVCAGECVPTRFLDWGTDSTKFWSRDKTKEWRCVNDVVRQRRVHLVCANGERRTYRIRTVKSCKCKRYDKRQNDSVNTRRTREERRRDRGQERESERSKSDDKNISGGQDRQKRLARSSADRAHSGIPS